MEEFVIGTDLGGGYLVVKNQRRGLQYVFECEETDTGSPQDIVNLYDIRDIDPRGRERPLMKVKRLPNDVLVFLEQHGHDTSTVRQKTNTY